MSKTKTRKKADSGPKSKAIVIRFHPDEWAWYQHTAAEAGKDPMAWARQRMIQRTKPLTPAERRVVAQARASRKADARSEAQSVRMSMPDIEACQKRAAAEGMSITRWGLAVLLKGWQRPLTPLPQDERVDVEEVAMGIVARLWPDDDVAPGSHEVLVVADQIRPLIARLEDDRAKGYRLWQKVVDLVDANRD